MRQTEYPGWTTRVMIPAALLVLALLLCLRQAPVENDLWWQLKAGIDTLSNGHVAREDTYSFSSFRHTWINHEWLAQVIMAKTFQIGGSVGLWLLRSVLLVLIVLAMFLVCSTLSGAAVISATSIALFFVPISSFFINLRPQAYSVLFTVLLIYHHYCLRKNKSGTLWVIPLLFLIWANIHPLVILGFAFIAFSYLSLSIDWDGTKDLESALANRTRLLLTLVASFIAILFNLNHFSLFDYVLQKSAASHVLISEFAMGYQQQTQIVLSIFLLPLMAIPVFRFRFSQHRTLIFFHFLLSAAALRYNRMFLFQVLFALPLFFATIGANSEPLKLNTKVAKLCVFCAFAILSIMNLQSFIFSNPPKHLLVVDPRMYPVSAVSFLKQSHLGPSLATSLDWGGYAIWHLSPEYKVSFDGRYDMVYDFDYAESQTIAYVTGDLEKFISRQNVEVILVPSKGKMSEALSASKDWKPVYKDDSAVVFVPSTKAIPDVNTIATADYSFP